MAESKINEENLKKIMKIIAHSKDPRNNELITYQFEFPTYLLPNLMKFKDMEITLIVLPRVYAEDYGERDSEIFEPESNLITLTTSKSALKEFFDKCCPQYNKGICGEKSIKSVNALYRGVNVGLKNVGTNEIINKNETTNIHLQEIAEQMYDLYNESKAVELKEGEWHIPFDSSIDEQNLAYAEDLEINEDTDNELCRRLSKNKISVSLLSNTQEKDYEKLIEIHNQLIENNKLDTFVHCARVMSDEEYNSFIKGTRWMNGTFSMFNDSSLGWCDSFRGFTNYKHIIKNEI